MSDDEHEPRGGHRFAFVLVAVLLVALVGGLATVGLKGDEPPAVTAGSGCAAHALKFTVTDSPEEFAEQKRFERDVNEITPPGFFTAPVDPVAVLHAASHSAVVVFYAADANDAVIRELRALDARGKATKAPVTIVPGEGDAALVAISRGYELVCQDATEASAAEVSRFAAQTYASLADPDATYAEPAPAPTEPTQAPSPVDP